MRRIWQLSLAVAACTAAAFGTEVDGSAAVYVPASPRDLHAQYAEIFRHGNRNAASHRWVSYILERSSLMDEAQLEHLFQGFCAVSGSPVYPNDYKRYRLRLAHAATGAPETGFLYFCCWPCVCDTWDFIRVDTKTVATADGPVTKRFAVIGDPCVNEERLDAPFIQPFDGRTTTLRRDAAEVRCVDGRLEGATFSDHGFVIISLFFDAPADPSTAVPPQPGRVTTIDGSSFQDDREFADMCADRASRGYDSGMGEIFRRVAAISPVGEPLGLGSA